MISGPLSVTFQFSRFLVIGSWLVFACLWRILRFRHRPDKVVATQQYGRFPHRTFHLIVVASTATIITGFGKLDITGTLQLLALTMGGVLTALGLVVALWGRSHLGMYWSGGVAAIYHSHHPVRSGPYKWVRHPIYTGELCMALGTTVWSMNWLCILLLFLPLLFYNYNRAKTEDGLLIMAFAEQASEYQLTVPQFMPRLSALIPSLGGKAALLAALRVSGAGLRVIHFRAVVLWSVATLAFAVIFYGGRYPTPHIWSLVVVVAAAQMSIGSFNDLCDHRLDSKTKPWRPLPSGTLSRSEVWAVTSGSFVVSIVSPRTWEDWRLWVVC